MKLSIWKSLSVFFICFSMLHCFGSGLDKRGSIQKYRNGLVTTNGGQFRIGILPKPWQKKSFNYKALLFVHPEYHASIEVSSFCKGAVDDGPLDQLTKQIHYGITNQKRLFQTKIQLDNREALRTAITGRVDGAQVTVDSVVMKMNECIFDFVAISIPDQYKFIKEDFEEMFENFKYISGPRID